jgi:2-polyprenyl-3-methyl-5-hydroxy-6-metoxy-1,4-benzoquinol methylase
VRVGERLRELAQLALAAAERKLGNVEFRMMNANEWNEPDAYDVVYARFLLQHLREPIDLLRACGQESAPEGFGG